MQKFLKESKEIFVQWSVLQAQELMQFMIASGSMSSALLTYNPTVPAVSKFFSAVNILVGAASFGNIFMNWDNLTTFQKAESILSVLQAGFSIARNFVLWRTVNTIFDTAASPAERMNAFYRYQVGGGSFDTPLLRRVLCRQGRPVAFRCLRGDDQRASGTVPGLHGVQEIPFLFRRQFQFAGEFEYLGGRHEIRPGMFLRSGC